MDIFWQDQIERTLEPPYLSKAGPNARLSAN